MGSVVAVQELPPPRTSGPRTGWAEACPPPSSAEDGHGRARAGGAGQGRTGVQQVTHAPHDGGCAPAPHRTFRFHAQRLGAHLDQLQQVIASDDGEPAGRTLDFISQELLREANTIASKSNDASISRTIVEVKGAIDRIKEQVQNVE